MLLVTPQMGCAWSWDFGSWERGPEGVRESRFGDISQTPPPRGAGREVAIWLGPVTQSGWSMVGEAGKPEVGPGVTLAQSECQLVCCVRSLGGVEVRSGVRMVCEIAEEW